MRSEAVPFDTHLYLCSALRFLSLPFFLFPSFILVVLTASLSLSLQPRLCFPQSPLIFSAVSIFFFLFLIISTINHRFQELSNQLVLVKNDATSIQAQNAALTEANARLSSEAQNLKMSLADASEANARLSSEAQNLKMSLAEASEANARLLAGAHSKDQAERDVVGSRLSELECELRSVDAFLKEVSGLVAEKDEEMVWQVAAAEEVMGKCEVCLREVMSAADMVGGQLSSVKSNFETKEAELSSVKSDLETKEAELSSVESDLETLFARLASEKMRKKSFSEEVMGRVEIMCGDLIEAGRMLGDLEEENRRLMEDFMALEAEKDQLESHLQAESMRARSLMEQVTMLHNNLATPQVPESQVAHGINGSGADCECMRANNGLATDPAQDGTQVVLSPAVETPRDGPQPDRGPAPRSMGFETGLPQSEPMLSTPSPRDSPLSTTPSPPSQIMDVSSSSAPLVISTPRDDPPETPGRLIVSLGMKGTPRTAPETPRSITSSLSAMKGTPRNDALALNAVDKGGFLVRQQRDWAAGAEEVAALQVLLMERDHERETAVLQVMSNPFPRSP